LNKNFEKRYNEKTEELDIIVREDFDSVEFSNFEELRQFVSNGLKQKTPEQQAKVDLYLHCLINKVIGKMLDHFEESQKQMQKELIKNWENDLL
jgi:hypothetical protein